MNALDRGEQIGRIVGSVAVPLLFSWLIVKVYERVKKRQVVRRKTAIVVIAIVLFILATAGRLGGKQTGGTVAGQPASSTPFEVQSVQEKGLVLPGGWLAYEFIGERFGIAFPAAPNRITKDMPGEGLFVAYGESKNDIAYVATSFALTRALSAREAGDYLEGMIRGASEKMQGQLEKNEKSAFQTFSARTYTITSEKNLSRGVVFAVPEDGRYRIYNLNVVGTKEAAASADYDRFVNSFKTLAR